MKLSHLYSNEPTVFIPIRFHGGLNVILAHIRNPKDPAKLGHNLGKTLLIDVVDFCLLKGINKDHFFKRHSDRFGGFVFFLEIELPLGGYLTIRRSAAEPTKIAFKRHGLKHQDLTGLPESDWDHWRETFDNAVALLDSILSFTCIKPWSYRKGIGYFLRGQGDYGDVFKLSKFGAGKHKDWKPYLAKVLGFDDQLLTSKYEAEAVWDRLNAQRAELQSEITLKPNDFEKLRASIAVKRDEVDSKVRALDVFDFHNQEIDLAREVADSIELEVAANNTALYNSRHDLAQIERGLQDGLQFDLGDIQKIFQEAKITFPDQLARDYDALLDFNRRILTERKANLQERANALQFEIVELEKANASLAARRSEILQVLGGTDSLKKFKDLQRQLDQDRATLAIMETKAGKLEGLISVQDQLRKTRARVDELTIEVDQMVRQSNSRYKEIQRNFSRIIKDVLHRTALLYVEQNGEGNLDMHAEFSDTNSDLHTEEDRGTSFRQMLCIAFDLAVLISYSGERFYHFVYHDGGLERLQNKLKLALLRVIREACENYKIQYIFSALSEDLPIDDDINKISPKQDEIVLTLDDSGDSGRLFRMATF